MLAKNDCFLAGEPLAQLDSNLTMGAELPQVTRNDELRI